MVSFIILGTILGGVILYLLGTGNNIMNSIPFIGGGNTDAENSNVTIQPEGNASSPTNANWKAGITDEIRKEITIPAWFIITLFLIILMRRWI